jgi:hypothetical protein
MRTRYSQSLCVYCTCEEATTVDHIPPKLLLPRPYPANLLTVPACRGCNASFQADDEYTRFVVSIDLRGSDQQTIQAKMPSILRSLQRPNAKVFSEYLKNQFKDTTVLGPDGRPMGQTLEADRGRINATGERMVRGLFFAESGVALQASAKVRIAANPGISSSVPAIMQFARVYARCPDRRAKTIGDAFSYAVGFHRDFSIWMLLLYGHFSWLATIGGTIHATE